MEVGGESGQRNRQAAVITGEVKLTSEWQESLMPVWTRLCRKQGAN